MATKLATKEKLALKAEIQKELAKKTSKKVFLISVIVSLVISIAVVTYAKWVPVVKSGAIKVVDIVTPDKDIIIDEIAVEEVTE